MNHPVEFLVQHGAAVLFVAVFIEQVGVPLPSALWLFAAGALVGAGQMHWYIALGAGALGSILADVIWFYLGRFYGHRVLGLLCRISLEPDTCVRKTQDLFARYGIEGVVGAKFVPGLSTLAPPLAGSGGFSLGRFLFFDGAGSFLYVGSLMLVGVVFSRQLEQIIAALANLGNGALAVVGTMIAFFIGYKFFKRRQLLNELHMARITPEELHQKQEAGENPLIFDLRSRSELVENPSSIRGAVHMAMDEVESRLPGIPRDRDIVVYCSCPNEVSSARVALRLHRDGILRVRPLQGGIDAWKNLAYPMDANAEPVLTRTAEK